MTRPFIKGLDLCGLFYTDVVRPLLAQEFPGLAYSAARIGPGSDVLNFDTPQSIDHDWGPRLILFLAPTDYDRSREEIDLTLRHKLPAEIRGYPTNFARHEDGTSWMAPAEGGMVNHAVTIHTTRRFFQNRLGFDPQDEIHAIDWLTTPENRLLMLTAGRVYYDGLGTLEEIRTRLAYYPRDVWCYLLAAQWRRIGQEEAFMGRCGQVDDELGSRIVAARLVRDIMRLCFLLHRRYAPYIKWFGSAFAQLDCASQLQPVLMQALEADGWRAREAALTVAYEAVARMQNALAIAEPLPTQVSPFHSRPFRVIHADRFADALRAAIDDEEVRALPAHLGGFDQFVDSTDALGFHRRLRAVYEEDRES